MISPGAGIARGVFEADAEIEIAERDPAAFPAPAHVNDLLAVRQHAHESRAGIGRQIVLHLRLELVGSGLDA